MALQKNKKWDEVVLKDGVVEIKLAPAQSAETVAKTGQKVRQMLNEKTQHVIVDASSIMTGDGTGVPAFLSKFDTLPVKKFAIFGATPQFANQRLKQLAGSVNVPEKVKLFRKESDARAWLEE